MRSSDWSTDVCASDLLFDLQPDCLSQGRTAARARHLLVGSRLAQPDAETRTGRLRHADRRPRRAERKSGVSGKSVSVRVALGVRRITQTQTEIHDEHEHYKSKHQREASTYAAS